MTDTTRGDEPTLAEFPHINFRRWPFDIVPSAEGVERWIGRPDVGKRLRRLVESATRVPTSRIVLIWATFGSGKSHALRHIEFLSDQKDSPVAAYVVVPRGIRSFLDIFRAIVDSLLEKQVLRGVGQELLKARGPSVDTDAERAMVRLAVGSQEERRLASAWLRGDKLPVRDVRTLGLSRRIETVTDAVQALHEVVNAIHCHHAPVVLLLDEVQELEELGRRLTECVGGLHKLFDLNPRGLTLAFSFTTGSRSSVRAILGEALFDRAADVIALPPFSVDEAVGFVQSVIRTWSVDERLAPSPFTPDAIASVVSGLDDDRAVLTPRVLMKAFDRILREAEFEIADGDIDAIDKDYASHVLDSLAQEDLE